MTSPHSTRRIKVFDTLLRDRDDIINGRLWMLEPKGLRFKHGETIAELKVPYHMGAEDEATVEEAILSLVALLMKRYGSSGMESGQDTLLEKLPQLSIPFLKDRTYRTDLFISESFEKKLAEEVLSTTPYIDSAVLAGWLAPDGYGRKFIRWTAELFEKAVRDEARYGGEERTADLLLLAVIRAIRKKKESIKDFRIKGLTYERLDLTVGLVIFATFKMTVESLAVRLGEICTGACHALTQVLLLSSIVPKSFLSIPSNLLSVIQNPYGINEEIHDALAPYSLEISEDTRSVAAMVEATLKKVRGDTAALEEIKASIDIRAFREKALRYLIEFDVPGSEVQKVLFDLYNEDRLIKNFLSDQKATGALIDLLEEVRSKARHDRERSEVISGLQDFLSSFRKKGIGGFFKSSRKAAVEALAPAVEGFYAYRIDEHIERFRGLMRGYLADRRREFKPNVLIEEYNRGRLYRFSTDTRPIIKTLELEEEGQLFIDMKDFSRKTFKVKEIAMADFMKEHFFKPILRAASKYGTGAGVMEDERGIRLTNIPGDAVIFSGGVTNLVNLARDIEKITSRYRQQLATKLPPRDEKEVLGEVHARFQARREELGKKREELAGAIEKGEKGLENKLIALGEEEHRLENTYRDELEAAIKGELEAGLYISYGTKAETMVLDPTEDFSTPEKVSIGEKINEAARGTYRNPMIRARLEVLLSAEKQKRKEPGLRYPFDVYIDRFYSLRMPPELENAFEKMISTRKLVNAQALAKLVSEEYLSDLKNVISGEPFSSLRLITTTTDIYNKGNALSQSALGAYIRENRATKRHFTRTVPARDLHKGIRDTSFFPYDPLEFVFVVEPRKERENVEIFHRSGEVIFKGFEASTPIVVYEMLSPDRDIFKALMEHHFPGWYEEAKKAVKNEDGF